MAKNAKNTQDETVVTPKAVKTPKAEVEEKKFVYFAGDPEVTLVSLSKLVPLDAVPVENAGLAMRETNKQHVEHLRISIENGEQLDAMKVLPSTYGEVVLDGLHRWAAYESHLLSVLEDAAGDESDGVTKEELQAAREEYLVPIEEVQVNSFNDALTIAFTANFKHGLPASDASRSRFALWLLAEDHKIGGKMSLREAARRAGCTHQAIMKAAKKLQPKIEKMVDAAFIDDDATEYSSQEGTTVTTAEEKQMSLIEKHVKNCVAAGKFFYEQNLTAQDIETYVAQYAPDYTKDDISSAQALLRRMFFVAKDTKASELAQGSLPIPTSEQMQAVEEIPYVAASDFIANEVNAEPVSTEPVPTE